MKKLVYKGIVFDDYVEETEGIWAEICCDCAKKYADVLSSHLDDGGVACGYCSVEGCDHTGHDYNTLHYYVDFPKDEVEWIYEEGDETTEGTEPDRKE